MGSRPPIQVALFATIPVFFGLWLFVVAFIPAEYLVRLTASLVIGAALMSGLVTFLFRRNRAQIHALADWTEAVAKSRDEESVPPPTDLDGHRIMRSLRKVVQKQGRQNRKRARDKDRLLTVLTYMNDGVMILNKSGRVRIMNPPACALLEVSLEEAENRSFVQVVKDHRIAELWRNGETVNEQVMQTLEFQEKLLRVIITPFLRGSARGFLIILQDLTEVSRLQTVRQSFVTNVSHELRTPLASVRALAETLREGALEDPPAAQRFLERMEIEVDALTGLVNELFDLSRIESGQMELEFTALSPSGLITPAVDRLKSQAERAQVALTVQVLASLPSVRADRNRIQQVIVNLVHNAIRFTPPGGSIHVSVEEEEGYITVSVVDTGSGIDEEHLQRIFERFYKADSSRRSSGSGLGLAIAKHIIQAHHGMIWAESEVGRGSTFYFSLPICSSSQVDKAIPEK